MKLNDMCLDLQKSKSKKNVVCNDKTNVLHFLQWQNTCRRFISVGRRIRSIRFRNSIKNRYYYAIFHAIA